MNEAVKQLKKEVTQVLEKITPPECSAIYTEVDRVFSVCSQDFLEHQGWLKLVGEFYVKACCPEIKGGPFFLIRNVVMDSLSEVFHDGKRDVSSLDAAEWKHLARTISANVQRRRSISQPNS